MNEIILAIVVVVVLLVILASLFLFTVRRVNILVKKIFVDKLQEYDFLIDDKEKKIEELNGNIEIKKNEEKELEDLIKKLKEEYGIKPDSIVDLKALQGDTADNIPGVPKVGEKTAKALMVEYGSLENIYAHVEEISKKSIRESLIENKELKQLNKHNYELELSDDIDELEPVIRSAVLDEARNAGKFDDQFKEQFHEKAKQSKKRVDVETQITNSSHVGDIVITGNSIQHNPSIQIKSQIERREKYGTNSSKPSHKAFKGKNRQLTFL